MRYIEARIEQLKGEPAREIHPSRVLPLKPTGIEHPSNSPEYRREYQAARRLTPAGQIEVARSSLKAVHGIELQQYHELFTKQQGRCAICARPVVKSYDPATKTGKRGQRPDGACVDHDHGCCPGRKSCGRCIRGLLCTHCNTAIGSMRDKPELLRAAADYIERARRRG